MHPKQDPSHHQHHHYVAKEMFTITMTTLTLYVASVIFFVL